MGQLTKPNIKKQKNGLTRGHFKLKPIDSSYWRDLFLIMRVSEFPHTPEWYEEAEVMISELKNIIGVFKGDVLIGGIWIVLHENPYIDVVIHPDYHGHWATKEKCAKAVKALMDVHEIDVVYATTTHPRAIGILSKLGFRRIWDFEGLDMSEDYVVELSEINKILGA
tara:strand:+ start:6451 stop:6951 length:501 start_codon:yes stop_codon:yes gene_type:complete